MKFLIGHKAFVSLCTTLPYFIFEQNTNHAIKTENTGSTKRKIHFSDDHLIISYSKRVSVCKTHLLKLLRDYLKRQCPFIFLINSLQVIFPGQNYFFIHYYLETLQYHGHIASGVFECIPEGCVYLLLCSQCFNC